MKKILIVVSLVASGLVFIYLERCSDPTDNGSGNATATTKSSSAIPISDEQSTKQKKLEAWEPTPEEKSIQAATVALLHGKVIDQFQQPVDNALIVCLPNYARDSMRRVELRTSKDGTFLFRESNCPTANISASAEGYYHTPTSSKTIVFAAIPKSMPPSWREKLNPPSSTSPESPLILTLRKMGAREPLLVKRQNGVLKEEQSYVIGLKPAQRLHVKYWFDPTTKRTTSYELPVHDWGIEITIEDGGIIQASKPDVDVPSSFLAPDDGYQPSVRFAFDSSMDDNTYKNQIRPDLFVKFDDGTFARLETRFSSSAKRPFWSIDSFYNPSGSRSTEFDPAIQIEALPAQR